MEKDPDVIRQRPVDPEPCALWDELLDAAFLGSGWTDAALEALFDRLEDRR